MILIDPPSPFAPKAEWQAFHDEMASLLRSHPDDADVKEQLDAAKQALED